MYPSKWRIQPDAIVAQIESDLDLFKMLADAGIGGFRNSELKVHGFCKRKKAIFCMFRNLHDRSHRDQLIQRIKNVYDEVIYQVFTDIRFKVKIFLLIEYKKIKIIYPHFVCCNLNCRVHLFSYCITYYLLKKYFKNSKKFDFKNSMK